MAVTGERTSYIGQSVERKEDAKLLTGESRFIDDLTLPGMVWAAVVRSPYAHARITGVDVSKALEADGVVAAFSGADLAEDWKATLPCVWLVTEDTKQPFHRPLATDKARHQGDGVAVVLAESRALAKDAAELVEVEYEPLDPVIDPEAALADGAPVVHEEFGTNHCYTWTLKTDNADGVFADAPVTVKERYRQQRLVPNAMEPRGVLAQHLPAKEEYTLWSATQIPHIARFWLSITCGIPESKLRVIAPDVGGGFGSKLNVYAEEALALALARRIGRPVKWIEERSEAYLATIHGRDHWQEIELAADEDGKIRGVRVRLTVGLGAYLQLVTAGTPILGAWVYGGAYDVEAYDFECVGVFTTATPTDAYRGAGRPETTYSQIVADRLGVPIENVEVVHGDTSIMQLGLDTYGSRSLAVGGVALYNAAEKVIGKARTIVAHKLEVAEDDLRYDGGTFNVAGTDRTMTVQDAALHAFTAHDLPDGLEPGLETTAVYDPPNFSWPGGAHVSVVEVDTETGSVDLRRYVAVDEIGSVVNPMIVDGMVHGGVAQGIGQALFEEAVFDEDGNLVTGSMVSYIVPSAAELIDIETDRVEAPSPTNPLGVKGVGETGTIASTPAVVNAIVDALSPYGVTDVEMPAKPERVWRAIQEGGAR